MKKSFASQKLLDKCPEKGRITNNMSIGLEKNKREKRKRKRKKEWKDTFWRNCRIEGITLEDQEGEDGSKKEHKNFDNFREVGENVS